MDETDKQLARDIMAKMREAFKSEDWPNTLDNFQHLRERLKGERALRLEATCLAARAFAAQNNRAAARALLKPLMANEYTKASHYEFLARAYLDLKQYADAAQVCERAQALREVETRR